MKKQDQKVFLSKKLKRYEKFIQYSYRNQKILKHIQPNI